MLAARQAQEKAELRDQQKLERASYARSTADSRASKSGCPRGAPSSRRNGDTGSDGRRRIEGPTFEPPTPRDIRAFKPVVDGGNVHYHLVGERGAPAFTDRGKVIDIRDSHRRETVLAALQLSAQKWGTFTVPR